MGDTTEGVAVASVETETGDAVGNGDDVAVSTVLTDDTNSDAGADASADDAGTDAGGDDSSGDDTGDAGGEGSQTPPETYADFAMPEGIELDEATLSEATPLFKELGLNQEQAQKLVDIYAQQIQAGTEKQVDTFNQLMNDWREQSKNDGEFGGDKFEQSVKVAQSAINKFGTPELKQLLEDHGVGNHPEVVRFMVRIGHTLKEDVPGAGAPNTASKDRVSILYPNDS